MGIDDDFEGLPRAGRRASDAPMVPLREHLETLLRGMELRHEQEMSDLAAAIKDFARECRDSYEKLDDRVHKMKSEIAALRLLEEHRRGERDARTESRAWVQWLPGAVAAAAAVYVSFFA